jgi:ribose 5-phosphate isomerase B
VKLVIASDHAGFPLKEEVRANLAQGRPRGDRPGAYTGDQPQDDYPDFAERVGLALKQGEAPRGILICGSGVGVCVAANKIPGIRAGMCHDTYSAHQGVEHDDMNVIVLGARIIGSALAFEVVNAFIGAKFIANGRAVCAAVQEGAGHRSQVHVRRRLGESGLNNAGSTWAANRREVHDRRKSPKLHQDSLQKRILKGADVPLRRDPLRCWRSSADQRLGPPRTRAREYFHLDLAFEARPPAPYGVGAWRDFAEDLP